MMYFSSVTGFQWDAGNERKSYDRHNVSQAEAEQVFGDANLLVAPDTGHSQDETRYHALGVTASGRRLHITFTMREGNSKIRVISARDMSRRERRHYEPTD